VRLRRHRIDPKWLLSELREAIPSNALAAWLDERPRHVQRQYYDLSFELGGEEVDVIRTRVHESDLQAPPEIVAEMVRHISRRPKYILDSNGSGQMVLKGAKCVVSGFTRTHVDAGSHH
jgi:hypothetical protein